MNRTAILSIRNLKEILRDPLTLTLGILFPVGLMVLFTVLEQSAPMRLFQIGNLAPAITVFGQSFFMMFTAILVSRDRQSALFTRFRCAPLDLGQLAAAYSIPFLGALLLQSILCIAAAVPLGYRLQFVSPLSLLLIGVAGVFHVAAGVALGLILSEKQIAGAGTLLINVAGIFSGAWIDLEQIGGVLEKIAGAMPFFHLVKAARALLQDTSTVLPDRSSLIIIGLYTAAAVFAALLLLQRAVKSR